MKFCSTCGAPVEVRVPPGDDRPRHVCSGCGEVHYVNPRVVVGSVCAWEERLLLCRRAIEPRRGLWTLPAGFLEQGETTAEGARREAWEEARARIDVRDVLAVYDLPHISQVQVFFRAPLLAPDVEAGPESLEVGLFAWDAVPWDDLAFPTVRWALRHYHATRDQPRLTPDVRTAPRP
ncbi:MAG: NUDIX hydrolase [Planctomycetes bacterium]|nr:NUDIX hydrolase [Planctomycetota bacterium]